MNRDMNQTELPVAQETLSKMLDQMVPANADDADIYIEHGVSESLALEEGRVKHVSASTHQGMGARVIKGELSGHAYTDRLESPALMDCARAARAIAESGSSHPPIAIHSSVPKHQLYRSTNPALTSSMPERKALLEKLDKLARSIDPRVKQVFANVSASFSTVHLLRMDGDLLSDSRPLVRLNISVVVEQNGKRETGSAGGGGRFDLSRLLEGSEAERLTREAVRLALLNLDGLCPRSTGNCREWKLPSSDCHSLKRA